MTPTKADPLTDWKGFYEELQKESERGAVIIAGAFLDGQLRTLISAFLIDDRTVVDDLLGTDKAERPLSSFSSRIKVAYCLGLIDKSMYSDLQEIRYIRNKFAHQMHGYTFDEPGIVQRCKNLRLAKAYTDAIPGFPATHRDRFLLCVVHHANRLALTTLGIERLPRPTAEEPKMSQAVTVGGNR